MAITTTTALAAGNTAADSANIVNSQATSTRVGLFQTGGGGIPLLGEVEFPLSVLNPDGLTRTPLQEALNSERPSLLITAPGTYKVSRPALPVGMAVGVQTDA